ncbi:MAG TPA: L-lactate dehydrogenase [Deinococcales bacterium]|nr:L-lactate dehydrogenase [Deinococcales bacterium]
MKVGIVGAGLVGSAAAFSMLLRGSCNEIVLVDKDEAKAAAQAADIGDAAPVTHATRVTAGDFHDLRGSAVVVLAAGLNQKPGQDRQEMLENNAAIYREVVPEVVQAAPDTVMVVATTPVDVMTSLAVRLAGPSWAGRVFGTGTVLDTARLRAAIAARAGLDPSHVHSYVIGEHGASEVLAWSLADIAGLPLEGHFAMRGLPWNHGLRNEITDEVKRAAARIVEGKGATSYSVGASIARIAEAVLDDAHAVLTVSSPTEPYGVAVSLPRLIGAGGVLSTFDMPLAPAEALALEASAGQLREVIARL